MNEEIFFFHRAPRWIQRDAMCMLALTWKRIAKMRGISNTKAKTAIMVGLEDPRFAEFVINCWNEKYPEDKI